MKMRSLLFVLPILWAAVAQARQLVGAPSVLHFSKQQYAGGGQTWDADMDPQGILYFANNEGLLTFNGHSWKMLPVPNHTRLRSVKAGENGRIYAGAQDDFGYYLADADGVLRYTSLKPLIPAGEREFADIWNIVPYEGTVFFRSNNKIFAYREDRVRVYHAPGEWRLLCRSGQGLYAQDARQGLLQFTGNGWKPIGPAVADKQLLVTAVLDHPQDTLLLFTYKHGIFKLHGGRLYPYLTPAAEALQKARIQCAMEWGNSQLLVGTAEAGCYILNRQTGAVIQQFGLQEGLQHNSIRKIFPDPGQNIWLALDNGIDMIRYNTAIKQIHPDKHQYLSTYAAKVFNRQLYIGTSDGLYVTPLAGNAGPGKSGNTNSKLSPGTGGAVHPDPSGGPLPSGNNGQDGAFNPAGTDNYNDLSFQENRFRKVEQSGGQVWSLAMTGGQLLMGHHEGAFRIGEAAAEPLLKGTGCWLFLPQAARTLIGCYNGLRTMGQQDGRFDKARQVNVLFESLRFLTAEQDSVIWASHPYRGVYRIVTDKDTTLRFTLFTSRHGLPSDNNNFVFRIRGRMVVATQAGIYEFDPVRQTFAPSPWLFPVLGAVPIQFLTEDTGGNIWFVSNKMPGVVDFHRKQGDKPYRTMYFPELKGMIVTGFENIYPYNDENIFVGGEKGMYHINYQKYRQPKKEPRVMISQVNARGEKDSLLFGGFLPAGKASFKTLPAAYAGFHFEYASPACGHGGNMEFSYRLEGFDPAWSEWAARTEKDYTNLPHGRYTFSVKARDHLGNVSSAATYAFRILPPWHLTLLAKGIYAALALAFIWICYLLQKRKFATEQLRHKREQEQLILHHEYEKEQREKQLISLQHDKLATDIQFKNKELATATMHLLQRGKLLFNIREELLLAIKKIEPLPYYPFKKVLRLFEEAEQDTEDWEQFSRHFDEVHNNFLSILKKHYPDLSTTDMKLCAYLRINLTTKEIAQSLGISVRGVETSRYRLRRKLEVPGETPLYDFLLAVTAAAPGVAQNS
ncbi:helix-turn-helix and ligand-binding sensor domain-containing protein [Chitinophaga barathri]|uniref:Transcriptional regulator n=1 Tax=Chitinophaga barathri TaxID=1647451 RepID=A0A3N4MDF3_9BACT|nr:triple tyrosine motif-containing protein [Chitinophaga barathri]RPD41962.1 transcriptional regulator [Chitinophaga barathri]